MKRYRAIVFYGSVMLLLVFSGSLQNHTVFLHDAGNNLVNHCQFIPAIAPLHIDPLGPIYEVELYIYKKFYMTKQEALNCKLIIAAGKCDPREVSTLMEEGGDINAIDTKCLYEESCSTNALIAASKRCDGNVIRFLIEKGANVNGRDRELGIRGTALVAAIRYQNIEAVKVLLECGASIEEKTEYRGWTAIDFARGGNSEIINYLHCCPK